MVKIRFRGSETRYKINIFIPWLTCFKESLAEFRKSIPFELPRPMLNVLIYLTNPKLFIGQLDVFCETLQVFTLVS